MWRGRPRPRISPTSILCLVMPKSEPKQKSAFESLVESITRFREEARERMTQEEFHQADEEVHLLACKVRASRI
jgi:hypothetical protein